MRAKSEVVIIGGGILGCSVAFHLSRKGLGDIVLLEMDQIGSGETGRTAAMLMHQTGNRLLTSLAKASIEEYHSYEDELGADFSFRNVGSILYSKDPGGALDLLKQVAMQNELGIASKLLTPSEILKLAPMLNTASIRVGAYCPLDGHIDPSSVMKFFCEHARASGVEIITDVKAIRVREDGARVSGVETAAGFIETKTVINAAGAMSGLIASQVGLDLPIFCEKRHLVLLRPPETITTFPIIEDVVSKWYFRPEGPNILLGVGPVSRVRIEDTRDIFSPSEEPDILEKVYDYFLHDAPMLQRSEVIRYWAGARSLSRDNLPILGPTDHVQGFVNCCGMSGFGITIAPICGKLVAETLVDGRTKTLPINLFSSSRFKVTLDDVAPNTVPTSKWRSDGNDLKLGDRVVSSLAREFGTPTYLYDGNMILDRYKRTKGAFREFEILFSVKANPNPAIMQILARAGAGAEVASVQELTTALKAGFRPEEVTFGGPGKSIEELEKAVRSNIGLIDVESLRELRILEEIGRRLQCTVPVTIRVNTKHRPSHAGEFMAGDSSVFGIDEEAVVEELGCLDLKHVQYHGIHTHVASQVLDYDSLASHYRRVLELGKELASALRFDLRVLNLGGGIGIPYAAGETHIELGRLGGETREAIQVAFPDVRERPRIQLELGRFFMAESGIYLTRIVDVKESRGTRFVIVDCGITGLSRPAMPWANQHRCTIVSKDSDPATKEFTVVGRSCLPSDILCESVKLPDPEPGDCIAIHDVGAYGYTMSMLLWASHIRPSEVLFLDGSFAVIRSRTTRDSDTLSLIGKDV